MLGEGHLLDRLFSWSMVVSVLSLSRIHATTPFSNRKPRGSWEFAGTLCPARQRRRGGRERWGRQRLGLLQAALRNHSREREQARRLRDIFQQELWSLPAPLQPVEVPEEQLHSLAVLQTMPPADGEGFPPESPYLQPLDAWSARDVTQQPGAACPGGWDPLALALPGACGQEGLPPAAVWTGHDDVPTSQGGEEDFQQLP